MTSQHHLPISTQPAIFCLTPLAIIGTLCATFDSAEDSQLLNLNSTSYAGPYGGLHDSQINETHYKISTVGRIEFGTNIPITDVQNVNNATVVAPKLGNSFVPALLDVYQVRPDGVPSAQVYFRKDMPYDEIVSTQQISIADGRFNYYTWDFIYIFYCDLCVADSDQSRGLD